MSDPLVLQLTRIADALERIADGGQLGIRVPHCPDELVRALEDYFGDGVFTVAGIMDVIEDDDRHPLCEAVERLVDLNASPQARATRLGQVLASKDGLELVGTRRNAAVYRVKQGRKG